MQQQKLATQPRPARSTANRPPVRRFCRTDAPAVATIWRDALLLSGHTCLGKDYGNSDAVAELMLEKQTSLLERHTRKSQAASFARDESQQRAMAVGEGPSVWASPKSRLVMKLQRLWHCLVVEDTASHQLMGYIVVSFTRPMALLPPPFPTTAPFQLHVDGLAVGASYRQQGVATQLLAAAERLAQRLQQTSLALHVGEDNDLARKAYKASGFQVVMRQPWTSPQQLVMTKRITSRAGPPPKQDLPPPGRSRRDGVYVWQQPD